MSDLSQWVNGEGPKKWWLTWVGVAGGFAWLTLASLGVAKFIDTLEPALYFWGSLSGIGSASAVTLHATGRKWQAASRYTETQYQSFEEDGAPGRFG